MHIGQAKITAGVTIRQLFMVEPHQVQNRRVKIVHVHGVGFDSISNVIRLAVDDAALDSATCQPA